MKPLTSAVSEGRLLGGLQLVAGLGFGVVALMRPNPGAEAASVALVAMIFGGGMFWFVYRRLVSEIMRRAGEPEHVRREESWRAWRRAALDGGWAVLVLTIFAILSDEVALCGGVLLGGGIALIAAAQRLRRRERSEGIVILHEARWRWNARYGMVDPRDFYRYGNAGRGHAAGDSFVR